MAAAMPYEKEENSDLEEAEMSETPETGDAEDMDLGEVEEATDLGEEAPADELGGAASFEEGAKALVEEWQPTTPEGEQYKADLQGLVDEFGSGPDLEEEEEGVEYEEGGLAPKAFGFQIGMMGKEAAKRAMGGAEK